MALVQKLENGFVKSHVFSGHISRTEEQQNSYERLHGVFKMCPILKHYSFTASRAPYVDSEMADVILRLRSDI